MGKAAERLLSAAPLATSTDRHEPTARHEAKRSRPGQGPRQRRPLQSVVGHSSLKRYINNTSKK